MPVGTGNPTLPSATPATTSSAAPSTTPPAAHSTTTPPAAPSTSGGSVTCPPSSSRVASADQLTRALAGASAGDVIIAIRCVGFVLL